MKTIYKKINLNTGWTQVKLDRGINDFYMIAQRGRKDHRSDTIAKDDVRTIRFEIGMDAFDKNKPLTINYLTLNFADTSSSDAELNKVTALLKVLHYPSRFYIKPVEITDVNGVVRKEGKTTIKVGISCLRLS